MAVNKKTRIAATSACNKKFLLSIINLNIFVFMNIHVNYVFVWKTTSKYTHKYTELTHQTKISLFINALTT